MTLWLPGAERLLRLHADELPQKDDLCGAFWGSLALRTAGYETVGDEPVDQDAVGRRAGSLIWTGDYDSTLPRGQRGRRDYRVAFAETDDEPVSGTSMQGVIRAVDEIADGALVVVPVAGPWEQGTVRRLLGALGGLEGPVTAIANPATRFLWDSQAGAADIVRHLVAGAEDGPAGEWDVGHFVALVGAIDGPGGSVVVVADTYPAIGANGIHLQPGPAVEASLRGGEGARAACSASSARTRRRRSAARSPSSASPSRSGTTARPTRSAAEPGAPPASRRGVSAPISAA